MSWDEWREAGLFDATALVWAEEGDIIVYYDESGWQWSGPADFGIYSDDKHKTLRVNMVAIAWADACNYWHIKPGVQKILNVTHTASLYYHLESK